jgi:hypothetical protein
MELFAAINNLSSIFKKQLEIYRQLTRLTSSLSAEIARTKGNMNGLTSKFEQENNLLEEVAKLKEQATGDISIWQENKHNANEQDVKILDNILKEVQEEIMRFLNAEKILKKQIDFYRTKNGTQ